jgi:hypothetical protein
MFINSSIKNRISQYQETFQSSQPFKYLVIDNFFAADVLEKLLQDFPSFERSKAISEVGKVGGKAVNENLADISDNYRDLANYIASAEFLDTISQLTGIKNLIHDPSFYGGGTHENLNGQELDAHVDFNMDERRWYHRRLNLILFLNKEWEENWGGCLELHKNPRQPEENEIRSFIPIFNRCIIFETNEYSWHGFSKINLPPEKQHLSRKSISIYLYTKDRPASELAPSHTTFYIHRPLAANIQPGTVLSNEDYQEIKTLIKRRDDLIYYYQQRELIESTDFPSLKTHIKRYLSMKHPNFWKLFIGWLRLKNS